MPYLGNQHIVGDSVNNFKVLDDISSFTATFDGSASSVVSTTDETIKVPKHRFVQGQRVTYNNGGGSNIGGLSSGTAYYVIYDTAHTIKLAANSSDAASLTAINLNAVGSGTSHTLNAAFDGVNKKFRITHGNGNRPRFHHATQLSIAINNVVQRPNNDANNFTEGYAIEVRDIIVFKIAPTINDLFFGSLTGETRGTFDIQDNVVDYHTADGITTVYNLSQPAPNSQSLLVSLDGVVQHPSSDGVTRSYELISGSNTIEFSVAPVLGVEIQIRHLGFAGASTGDVSGFYGRTGNVGLTSTDHITTGDINARNLVATGIATFGSSSTTIDGDANTIKVGTALTLGHTQGLQFHTQNLHSAGFEINQINASGIITASQFKGDGSELTGVSGFSTALSNDTTSLLNQIFKTNNTHNVAAGTSVTIQSDIGSGNIAFTRLHHINVGTGATLHIGAGTTFLMNVLNVF